MSDVIKHESVDLVIVGMGFVGGPVAVELARAGYSVVGLEKGPYWKYGDDWVPRNTHDEWKIIEERKYEQSLSLNTYSLRNHSGQFALPVRRSTKSVQLITPGHGVGGMAIHFGGGMGRIGPWAFEAYSRTMDNQGEEALPDDHDLEDWPISYEDAQPYYEEYEKMMGLSGENQDPFEPGADYPTKPHPTTPIGEAFRDAAEEMGYHPFPQISALLSEPYENQYGATLNSCMYCGFCGGFCNYPCEVGAKISSHVATVPPALETGNFDLRTFSYVYRIDKNEHGDKARGVSYLDARGRKNFQPAKVVFNSAWGFNIVRLMMLSGIGNNYDPKKETGSLGRAPTELGLPATTNVTGIMDIPTNAYPNGPLWGGGYQINDLADDNFDHKDLDFLGGATIVFGNYIGTGPNTFTFMNPGPDAYGSEWKAGLKDMKLMEKTPVQTVYGLAGPQIPNKKHFIDLDPHYTDQYGDPIARVTMDYGQNEEKAAKYLADEVERILEKMEASEINRIPGKMFESHHYDNWQAHTRGGARMGSNPDTSVFNKWLQCWEMENLFAAGEICDTFGDNTTPGSHVAGMLSYIAADGIKKYLEEPHELVKK